MGVKASREHTAMSCSSVSEQEECADSLVGEQPVEDLSNSQNDSTGPCLSSREGTTKETEAEKGAELEDPPWCSHEDEVLRCFRCEWLGEFVYATAEDYRKGIIELEPLCSSLYGADTSEGKAYVRPLQNDKLAVKFGLPSNVVSEEDYMQPSSALAHDGWWFQVIRRFHPEGPYDPFCPTPFPLVNYLASPPISCAAVNTTTNSSEHLQNSTIPSPGGRRIDISLALRPPPSPPLLGLRGSGGGPFLHRESVRSRLSHCSTLESVAEESPTVLEDHEGVSVVSSQDKTIRNSCMRKKENNDFVLRKENSKCPDIDELVIVVQSDDSFVTPVGSPQPQMQQLEMTSHCPRMSDVSRDSSVGGGPRDSIKSSPLKSSRSIVVSTPRPVLSVETQEEKNGNGRPTSAVKVSVERNETTAGSFVSTTVRRRSRRMKRASTPEDCFVCDGKSVKRPRRSPRLTTTS